MPITPPPSSRVSIIPTDKAPSTDPSLGSPYATRARDDAVRAYHRD